MGGGGGGCKQPSGHRNGKLAREEGKGIGERNFSALEKLIEYDVWNLSTENFVSRTVTASFHVKVSALLRLVFTSDGVGVVIRSVELCDMIKTAFWFRLRLRRLPVKSKLGQSESPAEAAELNQSQSMVTCIVIGSSFHLCFRLRQSGFH